MDEKAMLRQHLDSVRSAVLWKLEGLDEWQVRWPMTKTGTNLLGSVKHLTAMESRYLGEGLGRSVAVGASVGSESESESKFESEPNADHWALPHESLEDIVRAYRVAVEHSNAVLAESSLEESASHPRRTDDQRLRKAAVELLVETTRHLGQIEIIREQLDGRVGRSAAASELPLADETYWADHTERVRTAAVSASWPDARIRLYGLPGPDRDVLLAPILQGRRTATTSLLEAYRSAGEALPVVGEREVLLGSTGLPAGITETTDVRVLALDEVDLDHVLSEEDHFCDVAQWRAAHEVLWMSDEMRAELDDPNFKADDDTPVVLQRIRLLEVF